MRLQVLPALVLAASLLMVSVSPSGASDSEAYFRDPGVLDPRIVNGLPTFAYPTTGALLSGNDPGTATTWCSGTLIGCETFLTAAHCVCDSIGSQCQGPNAPDPSDHLVYLQHAGFFAISSIQVHTDFNFPVADVAVVKLATPVAGIIPTPINTVQPPPFGTPGTIVGFGRSGGGNFDYGLKRAGEVTTASCTFGISNQTSVCWRFENPIGPPGQDSNTCNADSGGPLFVDFGFGDVVAGITSGGTSSNCLPTDRSYDANVFFYRAWIASAGGPDLNATFCGDLPQIGEPGASVLGFTGDLGFGNPEGRHSFDVPTGTGQLRVAMNSIDDGSSNYDLYVKHGAPPTTGDFDCARNASGPFGYCEFADPTAGTWHVLVARASGSGAYQVTATTFESNSLISVSPSAIDFGTVLLGANPTDSITLTNVGDETVTVTGIDAGSCFGFDLTHPIPPFTLDPSDTAVIDVTFNPPMNAPFGCDVEIATTDPERPLISVALAATASATGTGAACDIELTKGTYSGSEPLVASSVHLVNPSAFVVGARIDFILYLPSQGSPVVVIASPGADGSLFLPAGLDTSFGPVTFFGDVSGLPGGTNYFICRVSDPATGEGISFDLNPFSVE